MLRAATPLTVVFFVAFVFTLLSVLSVPIIDAITLCTFQQTSNQVTIRYGVFGYCIDKECRFDIGYKPPNPAHADFSVDSSSTRHTLTEILIVHPVAALFQLISLVLALVAHFHSPSHSSRYLLALIIFMLPTLLLTLLAFLVDILLFIPALGWPGWLVLGAVILDVIAGIMLCAMRRTLVSRKARKKRIVENAEMSGENFYNRQAAQAAQMRADSPPPIGGPTVPSVSTTSGADKLPQFATFDSTRERKVSDDRVPLNDRTDTATTASSMGAGRLSNEGPESYAFGGQGARGGAMARGRGGRAMGPQRDEFGNPLPPSTAFGYNPDRPGSRTGSMGSMGSMGSNTGRGRGMPPPRGGYGRGGLPGPWGGPGRGGPPPGRGGMGPGFSAGAAAGALAGDVGRGRGPPPGYQSESYQLQDRPPMNGGYVGYGQMRQPQGPQAAPGYGPRRQSPGPPSAPGYSRGPPGQYANGPISPVSVASNGYGRRPSEEGQMARAESPPPLPGQSDPYARAESPPPLAGAASTPHHADEQFHDVPEMNTDVPVIGQAVEMDARHGSPAHSPGVSQTGFGHFGRTDSPLRQGNAARSSPAPYTAPPASNDVYTPARAAWQSNNAAVSSTGSTTHTPQPLPADLIAGNGRAANSTPLAAQPANKPAQTYYEDVDPRFSQDYPHGRAEPANIGVAIDTPPEHDQHQGYTGYSGGFAY